jgi:amino acid transporter
MVEKPLSQQGVGTAQGQEAEHAKGRLGPLLCWAVVFADIGTSVYYVPGILYSNVGSLAGFFVFLTLSVFVLLTLKYAEVTQRFPQGGGVVTVAAKAMNHWVGALGGMFILVDYFLTAALSCLSGIFYFSVVMPAIGPFVLWITVGILIVLGILNWVGISESAKVSLVGAVVAFISDLAVLFTVFTHISFAEFLSLFPRMFANHALSPLILLTGFAGSFLAFSGLESISQLSPVMKTPRKKVAGIALLLVVITVAITSPFLTMFTTLLLPAEAKDPVLSAQLVSLLAGHWGNRILQTEMAISASALLVFASNTAIIGSYHVFMALSRMSFFPAFILQRNRLRGTPHYSIGLATGIPIAILLLAKGSLDLLGNLYAFGLLGAFSLTCLGIDIVRYRERKAARWQADRNAEYLASTHADVAANTSGTARTLLDDPLETTGQRWPTGDLESVDYTSSKGHLWKTIDFWLGILTTVLVIVAWSTNLVAKPLATAFGGSVTAVGMAIAYFNYSRYKRHGLSPVGITHVEHRLPGSILAVLIQDDKHNETIARVAIQHAVRKPVVFLYISKIRPATEALHMFEFADPYLHDERAKETFARIEHMVQKQKQKIVRRYVYRLQAPGVVKSVWSVVHPQDVIADAEHMEMFEDINPDFVRYELTPDGKVVHLVKNW